MFRLILLYRRGTDIKEKKLQVDNRNKVKKLGINFFQKNIQDHESH